MSSHEITREMLFNYFGNKSTTLEKRRIEEWAKEPANKEFFYDCLAQWESKNLQYVSDAEAAIDRHKTRLEAKDSIVPIREARRMTGKWLIAASFLLAAFVVGYFQRDLILFKTHATSFGQTKSLVLSDGTSVILNANSSLTVPRFGFGDFTRNVFLKGEANFSVKHLPTNQKFIVKTIDGPDVVVLGTEFTVYTRMHGTKVVLNKGKIQLNYQENKVEKKLLMQPGELVTIDEKGKAVVNKTTKPENFSAWKEHQYVFDQTTLQDLCTLLNENFGLKVEIADPEIAGWTVSGSFKASDAAELLEALAETSELKYEKQKDKIVIHSIKR